MHLVEQTLKLRTIPAPSNGLPRKMRSHLAAFRAEACAVVSFSVVETLAEPMSIAQTHRRDSE